MATASYWVVNDNTLGYIYDEQPGWFNPLSSVKGGWHWVNGMVKLAPPDRMRAATLEDFDKFRVSAKGHLIGERYA